MALENYTIRKIEYKIAMDVIIKEHYLHRKAPCTLAFGLFLENHLKGVICYGSPASPPLCKGLAGIEHKTNILELTRLWVNDDVPKNGESFLIGRTIPLCSKEFLVSYAECQQGHLGVVYQATNWLYTGLSNKAKDWKIEGLDDFHCRGACHKTSVSELREKYGDRFKLVDRPRKHRYVYINAKGKRKQELLKCLKYPILPYPKRK